MGDPYQLIIIGGGPAGLSAGLYATRSRLSTLLIERAIPGGQIINAELVENYPGFPQGISGAELGSLMEQQATKYGLEIIMAEVEGVEVGE
ncbi:MAG: FAD-dependent oxidoreductase, partial [Dehalococcoidia bacterium]